MRQYTDVPPARRIPPGYRSVTGVLPSRYPSGQLHYESKLERDFLLLMEIERGVRDVTTQPMTVNLVVDGKQRIYTPDVMVTWHTRADWPFGKRRVIFEVKPLAVLQEKRATLGAKYREARRYFARREIIYRVVTERSIYTARQANAAKIAPQMRRRPDEELRSHLSALVRRRGPQRLGDIRDALEAAGYIRGEIMDAAYYLIGMRHLLCDLDAAVTEETRVTWWADTRSGGALEET